MRTYKITDNMSDFFKPIVGNPSELILAIEQSISENKNLAPSNRKMIVEFAQMIEFARKSNKDPTTVLSHKQRILAARILFEKEYKQFLDNI